MTSSSGKLHTTRSLDVTQRLDDHHMSESMVARCFSSRAVYGRLESLSPFVDSFDLVDAHITCGRADNVALRLDRLERQCPNWATIVSKRHVELHRDSAAGLTFITDLSTNGTFVNNNRLTRSTPEKLNSGDVISLGAPTLLAFIYNESAKSDFPPQLTERFLMTGVELGKGSYGRVILARLRTNCNLNFAVKILEKNRLNDRFSRALSKDKDVKNEVEIMLQLNHPNIVRFEDWIETDTAAFIVLEYVGGGEFFHRIVEERWEGKGLGDSMGRFYSYQLLSAVAYMHANKICHRDIKPENVLLLTKDDFTIVKLTDFGMAKPHTRSTMKTFCGTPIYIAPEILDGDGSPYQDKIDIWSLGVLFFVTLVGYPPFSEEFTDMDLNEQIRTGRLVFLDIWNNISEETRYAITKMLHVNQCLRPSATELLAYPWMLGKDAQQARSFVRHYQTTQPPPTPVVQPAKAVSIS